MQLVLDYREKALIARLPGATVKPLVLGDIVLEHEGEEIMIIERKTGADLSASICDGRYREQSARLAACGLPAHSVVYVIEGSLQGHSIPKESLLSSMVSLSHRLGFTVMRTDSVDETVEYLNVLLRKVGKPSTAPSSVVKKAKKDSITPSTIAAIMLSQIPYVSASIATAVLDGRSIDVFTTDLKANPAMLDAVVINKRKISKKVVSSIKDMLL
jgi:ERCC4-type nuclease